MSYVCPGCSFYGHKLHAAVCARTDLPIAWRIETARDHEASFAIPLLDAARERGFAPETCVMDLGYDTEAIHAGVEERDCRPIIPLKRTETVKRGDHRPPTCEHGTWKFAGADLKQRRAKWRCPHAAAANRGQLEFACSPASAWRKASRLHPLIPRDSKRFGDLYRGRGSVERCFGRLKHEYGLMPLRVRGLARVQLHADLTMLAMLSVALARARAVPLAA